jgi:NADH:ubiquinone oxidoreductase subunit 5 (subunit L)/multisubunit Na+/H+ antiporter MnhA subunit
MNSTVLFLTILGLPLVIFLALGLLWLLGHTASEKAVARTIKLTFGMMFLGYMVLLYQVLSQPNDLIEVRLGEWFHLDHYVYPLAFQLDQTSMPFAGLTIMLCGIVGSFSITYLHRDPGFLRFFLLLVLFSFGSLLVFTASSLDLLIAGWELVGITSVLLIAFFQYRPEPVRNALRVFATYRVADLFILVSVFLAHQWFGAADWARFRDIAAHGDGHVVTSTMVSLIAVLLVFAASGKSAQGPFCGWLARAMEGPTPSSAIFYGAISVHAGPYLLLRASPIIHESLTATCLLFFIGITTAIFSTMIQRSSTDAKTSLAYAAQTQLGIIFVEISLGWHTIALVHVIGHATVRAMQFLRSPSMLCDYHRVHSGAGGQLAATGTHYQAMLSDKARRALYCFTLFRGFHDAIWDRFFLRPLFSMIRLIAKMEFMPSKSNTEGAMRLMDDLVNHEACPATENKTICNDLP